MKKTKKLNLRAETIRSLSVATLVGVVGGLSGHECSAGWSGCAACGPGPATDSCACDTSAACPTSLISI
jgi:hypothetical protein